MAALVDSNILVYRVDPRDRRKQKTATDLLRRGLEDRSIVIPHQAIIELYAAVMRTQRGVGPLLTVTDATRETEDLMVLFDILYPTEQVVRAAMLGTAAYLKPRPTLPKSLQKRFRHPG